MSADRILAVLAAAATILAAVLGWHQLDTPATKVLAVSAITVFVLLLILADVLWRSGRPPKVYLAFTAALAVLTGTVVALGVLLVNPPVKAAPTPAAAAAPTTTSAVAPELNTAFTITLPDTVPNCTRVTGNGTIPHDEDLWVLSRDSDGDYWPLGKAHTEVRPATWTTDRLSLGRPGDPAGISHRLYAVLVDPEVSDYVTGLLANAKVLPWPKVLPYAVPVANLTVSQGNDHRDC